MKRRIHNILSAFLCVCLLISYVPAQALADPGVGDAGEFVDGQASTTVKVIATEGFSVSAKTEDYAATRDAIKNDSAKYDLNVEITGGTAPYTYTWTRTVDENPDSEAVHEETTSELENKYELSKHTDTLVDGSAYAYKVVVKDSTDATVEATIKVTVSNEYDYKPLEKNNVKVTATIHYMADLSVSTIDPKSQTYSFLQEAADGKKIVDARQVDLTGDTNGKAPFTGDAEVEFPVDASLNGKEIAVLCFDSSGKTTPYTATVADGKVTITTAVLGAFALAYSEPDDPTYTITSSVDASGGGQISPLGERTYAAGATPSYILLPDSGYSIDKVFIDGDTMGVAVEGNTHTFVDPLSKDHTIKATFKKETPVPTEEVTVTAQVTGGNGTVQIDAGTANENVNAKVKKGSSSTIGFHAKAGYVIDTVTVDGKTVTVMGDTYLLSAVMADTAVVVTYKEGVTPPTVLHTVTPVAGAGGTISPDTAVQVGHGKSTTFSILPNENYRIHEVTVGGKDVTAQVVNSSGALTIENIVADLEVKATFEYVQYTVTASVTGSVGGTISPAADQSVNAGASLTYYFTPEAGYELAEATLQSGADGAEVQDVTSEVKGGVYILKDIRSDYDLVATFEPSSITPPDDTYYTVTATAGSGGKISPEGISRLKAGESQTFNFIPDANQEVTQVTVNGNPVEINGFSYSISNILKNSTIHVTFGETENPPEPPISYSVVASAGTGGSVSPKGTTIAYEHGSVLVEFLPDSGYQLDQVTVNNEVVGPEHIFNNSYRVYVDEYAGVTSIPVVATFKAKDAPVEPEYFMLTTEIDPAGTGSGSITPEGTTKIASGKDQTIHFAPESGSFIAAVTVGNVSIDLSELQNNTYLLEKITEDTTVSVKYDKGEGPVFNTYTITSKATVGGTISPEGATVVNEGGSLTYTFTAQEGYKLSTVLVDGSAVTVTDLSYTLADISKNHTITASFVRNSLPVDEYFTVHASAGADGKISPEGDVRVAAGKDMTFYFQPNSSKVVDTVTVNGKKIEPAGNSFTFPSVTADSSIIVTFRDQADEPNPPSAYHTLTATSTTGGSISPSGATQVTPGGQMLYTIIADAGYELKALSIDGTPEADFSGNTYRFSAVTASHAIHAEFVKKGSTPDPSMRYKVNASVVGDGGTISPEGETSVPANGSQTFYFTPTSGYQVKTLQIGESGTPFDYTGLSYTLTGINADTSIKVTFGSGSSPDVKMHEVTTTTTLGGTVSPLGKTKVAEGGSLLLTFTPDAGQVLKSVKQDGADVTSQIKADGSYRLANVTASTTIDATFEAGINGNDYRMVSVSAGEGGTISPAGELRIAKGGVQSFTVSPDKDKVLEKLALTYADRPGEEILVDISSIINGGVFVFDATYDLTKDSKIVATFKDGANTPDPARNVSLNVLATSGGSISPTGSMSVEKDSSVLFTLTPDAGYKLSSVTVDNVAVEASAIANNTYMHKATKDAAVKATFVRVTENPEPGYYQVTTSVGKAASGDASGTISPSGVSRVKAGESQTFAFIPNTDCALDTVTVDGKKVAVDGFTYTLQGIAKDTAIVATFKTADSSDPKPPAMATIKASASAGGSISPAGTTKVTVGTSPLFTLMPDAGYHIEKVVVSDGTTETTIEADSLTNKTYRFEPVAEKNYTIVATYAANPTKPVDPASYSVFASVINGTDGLAHGKISPAGEQKVAAGASQTFSLLPDKGYVIDKIWVKDSAIDPEKDPSFTTTASSHTLFGIDRNKYIAISFKAATDPNPPVVDTCTINASSTAGGMIAPEGLTEVAAGTSLTYTFTAFEGYELYQIKLDGTTTKPASEISGNSYLYTNTASGEGTHSIEAMYKLKGTDPVDPDDPDKPAEKVTITASAGEGGTINPVGAIKVEKGTSQTFHFYPHPGYEVSEVLVNEIAVSYEGTSYTLENVLEAATIKVNFKQGVVPEKKYNVTVSASSGGTITPSGTISVSETDPTLTLGLKADANYELKQLLVDGKVVSTDPALSTYTLDGIAKDTTVRAEFQPSSVGPTPTYAVVHAAAGPNGAISPSGDVQVPLNSDRTFGFTPNEGYVVESVWLNGEPVTDPVVSNSYTIKGIAKDTTLTVTFEEGEDPNPQPTMHVITSSTTSGGMISPYGETRVAEGKDAPYMIKADKGYRLSKLEVDGSVVEATDNTYTIRNVLAPHTIKASFEKIETPIDPKYVTVHAKAGAGGKISPEGDSRVEFGSAQTFTFVPDAGMAVDKVTVNGDAVSFSGLSYTLFSVKAEATIEVSFKSGSTPPTTMYTLSASAAAGGEISPAGDTKVLAGGSLVYSIIPEKGYKLSSVKVDGIEVGGTLTGLSYRFADVNSNHTIAVTFDRESEPPVQQFWTIDASVSTAGGGIISPEGALRVADGGTQSFSFIPDAGKKVTKVAINGGVPFDFTGSSYTLFNVKANSSIEVTFEDGVDPKPVNQFEVTTSVKSGSGTVSPDGMTKVNEGSALLATFIPDSGWEVDEVFVNNEVVQRGGKSYRLTNVTENKNVSVSFKEAATPEPGPSFQPVTVKIMPTAEGVTGGTVSPSGSLSIPTGESKKFYMYPTTGYTVEKVLLNGTETTVTPCLPHSDMKPNSLAHRTDLPASTAYCFDMTDVRTETTAEVFFTKTDEEPEETPTHPVVTSASTGGMIFSSGQALVPDGEPMDFAIKADSGYHLAHLWKTTNVSAARSALGSDSATDVKSEVVNGVYRVTVTESMLLHAVFEADAVDPADPEYVTVNASVVGNGAISPQGDTRVKFGESQTFTLVPQGASGLKEVTVNGRPVTPVNSTVTLFDLKEDTSIVATFSEEVAPDVPTTFNLSATVSTGGSVWPLGLTNVAMGASLLYTCLPDEGYVLKSVKDTANGTTVDITDQVVDNTFRVSNVSADHAFAVTFEASHVDPPAPTYCTISATSGANGKISPSGDIKVTRGASATFSFLPNTGYVVDTVKVDGRAIANASNPYTLFDVNADSRISVTFKQGSVPPLSTHTVETSVQGGEFGHGTVSPAGKTPVIAGSAMAVSFVPDSGYVVNKVMVDGISVPFAGNSYQFASVDQDHTLVVSFRSADEPPVKTYMLTPSAGAGGTISPSSPVLIDEGQSQTFRFTPDAGFAVSAVKVDGVNKGALSSYTFDNVQASHTIAVEFSQSQKYTISASAGKGGTIAPSGDVQVTQGTWKTFTFAPEEGYTVSAVTVDGVRTETNERSYLFPNVQEDHTINVEFASGELVTVNASAGEGGAITPSGAVEVVKGDQCTFALHANDGYRVDKVMLNGKVVQIGGTSYTLSNAQEGMNVSVLFAKEVAPDPDEPFVDVDVEVKVSQESKGGGAVSPSGTITMVANSNQKFYAFPEKGYTLDKVLVDGVSTQFYGITSKKAASLLETNEIAGDAKELLASTGGAYGGFWFEICSPANGTKVEVQFRPLNADEPQPEPVFAHTVKVSASPGGMISPLGETMVPDGESMNLSFKADNGNNLKSLEVNGIDVTDGISGDMLSFASVSGKPLRGMYTLSEIASDTTIVATFEVSPPPKNFTITANVEGGHGKVSPSGAVSSIQGSNQTFTFTPDPGYQVASVSVDGQTVEAAGSYTFYDVQAAHNLLVSFKVQVTPGPVNPLDPLIKQITRTGDTPLVVWVGLVAIIAGALVVALMIARRPRSRHEYSGSQNRSMKQSSRANKKIHKR